MLKLLLNLWIIIAIFMFMIEMYLKMRRKKQDNFLTFVVCQGQAHGRVIYPVLYMDFAVCKGRHTAKLPYVCHVPTAAHGEVFFNFSNFTVCSVLGLRRRGNGAV